MLLNQGFLPCDDLIFDFKKYGMDDFVRARDYLPLNPVNRHFSQLIDNKAFLPILLQSKPEYLPDFFLTVSQGKIIYSRGIEAETDIKSLLKTVLTKYKKLIVKPNSDGGGRNISWITESTLEKGLERIQKGENLVINNCLENISFLNSIFPHSLNTARVVFFRNSRGKNEIQMMAQRFGNSISNGVDNVSKGGLACGVDLNTGRFSKAYTLTGHSKMGWHDKHFETGAQLEGISYPDWEVLFSKIKALVDHFDFIEYAGLDLGFTPNGIKLIEINSLPQARLLQVGGPAFLNEEFKKFLYSKGYRPKSN
jgi:hypothetical protein